MDTYLKICFLGPIHDWNWIGYGWRMVSLMSWCEGCVTKIHQSCVWKKSNFAIFGRLLLSYIEYVWNVAPKIKSLILSSFGAKIQTVNFLHSLNPDDVHFWWPFMLLHKFFKFLNTFWFCLQYGRERILSLGLNCRWWEIWETRRTKFLFPEISSRQPFYIFRPKNVHLTLKN